MFRRLLKPGPKYSWKKVFLVLALSCCGISGGTAAGYFFYRYTCRLHEADEASVIEAIVQTAALYAPLQTAYLSEVLDLSGDRPSNFSRFDLKEAYERLVATYIIREACIKKIKPNILYLEYEAREPIAYLGDYTNTAIDGEGALFPYLPFYPPRRLPEVYLGAYAPPNPWGEKLEGESLAFVHAILRGFQPGSVERIDLSQSKAASAGTRQIVVVLKKGPILRLTPKNYAQELEYYHILAAQISLDGGCVLDFRNPEVAYIFYGK
ncbi:MAG: hypothetical protein JJU12_00115 [Chlamydiales bacterium]|nr:hypothetical protein [Chlamydiales bacterium]